MAVPKQKLSRSRTRRRKAQWLKGRTPTVSRCPSCGAARAPHTVCAACGAYGGRQVTAKQD